MFRIAIIDSGIMSNHPAFEKSIIKGIGLAIDHNGNVYETPNYEDEIGHGTALYYLISKNIKNADIVNIKIYRKNEAVRQLDFERYLEFIYSHYDFDIINISMGLTAVKSTEKLQDICQLFYNKKTVIVSAFDNYGAISFPAALNYVIGVDSAPIIESDNPIILENNIVNIIGKSTYKKVAWVNPLYNVIKGTSFTCGEITAWIARMIIAEGKDTVIKRFQLDQKIIQNNCFNKMKFQINRAAVFPFNKECHSIANYENYLDFEISNYYSLKITGQVGKKINQIIPWCGNDRVIKNIDNIVWNDFDTLIIGHTDYLEKLSKKTGIKQHLIETALQKGKNVFLFDYVSEYTENENVYMPYSDKAMCIPCNGKLFQTNVPIICVCGTNSKQGKYTLQLYIRKKLIEAGYKVGQMGTEPSAPLFGMDEVFHCGYNKHFNLDNADIKLTINQQIWDISNNGAEIILSGTQSGLLAYNNRNIINSALRHQIVFEAIQPDVIIVCINPFDSIDFIKRVVNTAEGLSKGKVIGLVCFPIDYSDQWGKSFMKVQRVSEQKEEKIKKSIMESLKLNVYMLDKEHELDMLINKCIDFMCSST